MPLPSVCCKIYPWMTSFLTWTSTWWTLPWPTTMCSSWSRKWQKIIAKWECIILAENTRKRWLERKLERSSQSWFISKTNDLLLILKIKWNYEWNKTKLNMLQSYWIIIRKKGKNSECVLSCLLHCVVVLLTYVWFCR